MVSEQRPEDLPLELEQLTEAYHDHDPAAMASLYSPDCRFAFPGIELRGRAQVKELWTAWFHAFPDVQSDILRASSSPGLVAIEWEERGTHRGRLRVDRFDLRPSGRALRWRGVSVYVLGDEGIESVTYHVDRLQLFLPLTTVRNIPGSIPQAMSLWREARQGR